MTLTPGPIRRFLRRLFVREPRYSHERAHAIEQLFHPDAIREREAQRKLDIKIAEKLQQWSEEREAEAAVRAARGFHAFDYPPDFDVCTKCGKRYLDYMSGTIEERSIPCPKH